MVLTSWDICHTSFPGSGRSDMISHNTSQLQSWLRIGIGLTYRRVGMPKPRHSLHDQFLLYLFKCSCLYIKAKMYHCWSIHEDIPAIERSVEAKIEGTINEWSTDLFTAHSMQTSKLFCWTVTNNIFNAKSSIDAAVCLISSPTWSW